MEIHLFQGFPYTTRKFPFPRLKLTLKGEESRKEGPENGAKKRATSVPSLDRLGEVSKVSTICCTGPSAFQFLRFNGLWKGRESLVCGRVILVKREAYERRSPRLIPCFYSRPIPTGSKHQRGGSGDKSLESVQPLTEDDERRKNCVRAFLSWKPIRGFSSLSLYPFQLYPLREKEKEREKEKRKEAFASLRLNWRPDRWLREENYFRIRFACNSNQEDGSTRSPVLEQLFSIRCAIDRL